MIKIPVMSRDPSDGHKFQAQSIPEVKDALDAAVSRVARDLQFRGRKLRVGPALNAIALYYLSMDDAERERIVRRGLEVYERLLESDGPDDELLKRLTATPGLVEPATTPDGVGDPAGWTGVGPGVGRVGHVKPDRKRADKAGRPPRK